MRTLRRFVVLLILASLALATPNQAAEGRSQRSKKLWLLSIAVLVAVNVADVVSSQGRMERNPLLRDASGRFDTRKAVAIKLTALGSTVGLQALVQRGKDDPRAYKAFTIANFGYAGAIGWVTVQYH